MTKKQGQLQYTLRLSRRAKRVRLVVCCNAEVVVTVPPRVDMNIVDKFILDKMSWIMDKVNYFRGRSRLSFAGGTREEYLEHKESARKFIISRLEHFNQFYGFRYNRISIRNQKSRWGSCSRTGNLNFNYKLALLPQHCADYIIIHELCHLKELNHSVRFWRLVEKVCPNHKQIVGEIRAL